LRNKEVVVVGNRHVIKNMDYPRYKAYIDFSNPLPLIKEVIYLDQCDALDVANVIKDLHQYIIEFSKKKPGVYVLHFSMILEKLYFLILFK
jgi:hypothetical protein